MLDRSSSNASFIRFESAVRSVRELLQAFVQEQGFSADTLAPIFGRNLDLLGLQHLEGMFGRGELNAFSPIESRPQADLNGALGAYEDSTDTIYLAQEFLATASQEGIISVLLEEIGRSIEDRIGDRKPGGNEGASFSDLVRGVESSGDRFQSSVGCGCGQCQSCRPNFQRLRQVENSTVLPATDNFSSLESTVSPSISFNGFTSQARAAFQYAVDLWDDVLDFSVPLEIEANFTPLGGNTLGSAGPGTFLINFSGAESPNTWYPVGLANQFAGTDLAPNTVDITANFSSNFSNWYFGTDGNAPSNQFDFVTVVLHELGHGLGFSDFFEYDSSSGLGRYGLGSGQPSIFDRFIENGAGTHLIDIQNSSTALGSQLVSNDLFFDGSNARAANGGNSPLLYSPNPFRPGSSIAHLDEASYSGTPDGLMTPQLAPGEVIHDPGPITLGILSDLGWQTAAPTPSAPADTSVQLDGAGNLSITDTNGGISDDTLTLTEVGSNLSISDPSQTLSADTGTTQIAPNTVEVPLGSISGAIVISTEFGIDAVTADGITSSLSVQAGDGNDTVRGGEDNDAMNGNNDRDLLYGNAGNDSLKGGFGDDTLYGDRGNDLLYGEGAGPTGTGNDSIFGGDGNDSLFGRAGNDAMNGNNDRDLLRGNAGSDSLKGGFGDDTLYGDRGNDLLYGEGAGPTGTGNDSVFGGDGNDTLYGRAGNDAMNGNNDRDLLYGNGGNDSLKGGFGDDTLYGDRGNDLLYGEGAGPTGTGNDSVFGGDGNDTLYGRAGNDWLQGGSGNDILVGDSGNDTLVGASSSNLGRGTLDLLRGDSGSDRYILGEGGTVYYDDGISSAAGTTDYARIQSFNPSEDILQLAGTASDYVLGNSPIAGVSGTGIFLNTTGTDEFIGVMEGISGVSLTDSMFAYV